MIIDSFNFRVKQKTSHLFKLILKIKRKRANSLICKFALSYFYHYSGFSFSA